MPSASPSPSTHSSAYDTTHRAFLQSFLAHSTLTLSTARPILASILTAAASSDTEPGRTALPNDITEAEFTSYINTLNAALAPYDFEIRSCIPQTGGRPSQTPAQNGRGSITHTAAIAGKNERIYALVNTTSDPQTQLATTLNADELAFIKRLLDAMFETYNAPIGAPNGREVMAVTEMQATQLARVAGGGRRSLGGGRTQRTLAPGTARIDEDGEDREGDEAATQTPTAAPAQSLTLIQAETVLKQLLSSSWLARPTEPGAKNYYVLAPRGLMELKNWLVETYNEEVDDDDDEDQENEDGGEAEARIVERIKMCKGCGEIVLSGQRCAEKKCGVRIHDFCVGMVMRGGAGNGRAGRGGKGNAAVAGENKCPECSTLWTGRDFVGVRAVKEIGEKWLERQGMGRRSDGRAREETGGNDERGGGEEDEDEEADEEQG